MKRRTSRKRRKGKATSSPATSREQITRRNNALHALTLMRTKNLSLRAAVRELQGKRMGIAPKTVVKLIGKALTKKENGHYKAKPSDRFLRHLNFLSEAGTVRLPVRGSRLATRIAKYENAVRRYLETGDAAGLQLFVGKSIKVGKTQYPFVTDTRLLNQLGSAGEVSFEDLYAR